MPVHTWAWIRALSWQHWNLETCSGKGKGACISEMPDWWFLLAGFPAHLVRILRPRCSQILSSAPGSTGLWCSEEHCSFDLCFNHFITLTWIFGECILSSQFQDGLLISFIAVHNLKKYISECWPQKTSRNVVWEWNGIPKVTLTENSWIFLLFFLFWRMRNYRWDELFYRLKHFRDMTKKILSVDLPSKWMHTYKWT